MKILICLPDMYFGGTEKALLTMLKTLELGKKDELTLGLIDNKGELINQVPKEIKVIKFPLTNDDVNNLTLGGNKKLVKKLIKEKKIFEATKVIFGNLFGEKLSNLKTKFDKISSIETEYDIAISYQLHDIFVTRFVAEKVKARKKAVWVHNDIKTTKIDHKYIKKFIQNYDNIFTVSKYIEDECRQVWEEYSDRISTFYNFINVDEIVNKANQKIEDERYKKGINTFLSVGRLDYQKGFDIAIKVAKILKKRNLKFIWNIIGDGEEQKKLHKLALKNKVDDVMFFLGSRDNPYKYMKDCDIYIQPSRHEGYCTTTNEARILRKAIITTNVSGSEEQFVNGFNGIITDKNPKNIAKEIIKLTDNIEFKNTIIDNLKLINYNEYSKNKWDDFIKGDKL